MTRLCPHKRVKKTETIQIFRLLVSIVIVQTINTRISATQKRSFSGIRSSFVALVATCLLVTGCSDKSPNQSDNSPANPSQSSGNNDATPRLITVPDDYDTISDAVTAAAPGSLILVSPGIYKESVTISTADITLRGLDRNQVIIDGEGLRANGIQVIASGVRIENLTVKNHTFNGVIATGMFDENGAQAHNLDGYEVLDPEKFPPLQRFSIQYVTASNNGLYGIYAFNSQQGVIANNYTSGSADSGFYVGQCPECNILVTNNVAENNAIGYENANASDSVFIAGNRFSNNRVGLTLISWYQEAYLPQKGATVVGNLIANNTSETSPSQAAGGFGQGIGLSGAQNNLITKNLIANNPRSGVEITNTEDIPSIGNQLVDNNFVSNGIDFADVSAPRTPSQGNCWGGSVISTLPVSLQAATCPNGSANSDSVTVNDLPTTTVPVGMSFLKVPAGPTQVGMPGDLKEIPKPLPTQIDLPKVTDFSVPEQDFLSQHTLNQN